MKNDYYINGDTVFIILSRAGGTKLETMIDKCDFDKANSVDVTWFSQFKPVYNSYYVVCSIGPVKNRKRVHLHRLLTDAGEGKVVDHINHNTLDNRRSCNLRVCTNSENQQNRKSVPSNNKSGVMGVKWVKRDKKWYAEININKKSIFLGHFSDLDKAADAVAEARRKYMTHTNENMYKPTRIQ